jgi:hypothetical protein
METGVGHCDPMSQKKARDVMYPLSVPMPIARVFFLLK